jgi:general secretion pathway protein M
MRAWFDNLVPREQLFVIFGATIVAVALLWGVLWAPLTKSHKTLVASVSTWERSLAELRPLKSLAQTGGTSSRADIVDSGQTPVVIVDRTLRARGMDGALKRSQPTTSTGIRVEFEGVAFDQLILWLGDMSTQYAMEVQAGSLSAAARAGPGHINATLTLERSF